MTLLYMYTDENAAILFHGEKFKGKLVTHTCTHIRFILVLPRVPVIFSEYLVLLRPQVGAWRPSWPLSHWEEEDL